MVLHTDKLELPYIRHHFLFSVVHFNLVFSNGYVIMYIAVYCRTNKFDIPVRCNKILKYNEICTRTISAKIMMLQNSEKEKMKTVIGKL